MLDINLSVLWDILNVIIFFLLLKKFLFKPVTEMMEKRQRLIADSLQEAENKKLEANQLKSDYETELKNASGEAAMLIKEARERAEIEYSRIIKEAKEESAKVMTDAERVIELERKKSLESAQAEIAGVALLAAAKIIGKNVDEDTSKQFLGDFINEVGAVK